MLLGKMQLILTLSPFGSFLPVCWHCPSFWTSRSLSYPGAVPFSKQCASTLCCSGVSIPEPSSVDGWHPWRWIMWAFPKKEYVISNDVSHTCAVQTRKTFDVWKIKFKVRFKDDFSWLWCFDTFSLLPSGPVTKTLFCLGWVEEKCVPWKILCLKYNWKGYQWIPSHQETWWCIAVHHQHKCDSRWCLQEGECKSSLGAPQLDIIGFQKYVSIIIF